MSLRSLSGAPTLQPLSAETKSYTSTAAPTNNSSCSQPPRTLIESARLTAGRDGRLVASLTQLDRDRPTPIEFPTSVRRITLARLLEDWDRYRIRLASSTSAMLNYKREFYDQEVRRLQSLLDRNQGRIDEFRRLLISRYHVEQDESVLFASIRERFPDDQLAAGRLTRITNLYLGPLESRAAAYEGYVSRATERKTPRTETVAAGARTATRARTRGSGLTGEEKSQNALVEDEQKRLRAALEDAQKQLIGRTAELDFVARLVAAFAWDWRAFQRTFLNFVITGGPGVGKTTLARVIANVMRLMGVLLTDSYEETSRADWVGGYLGETAIKTNTLLERNSEGTILFDEAYDIARRDSNTGNPDAYGAEALTALVNFLDKNRSLIVVICAGYRDLMLCNFFGANPGLPRRFPYVIDMPPYKPETLATIFFSQAEASGIARSDFTEDARTLLLSVMRTMPQLFEFAAGDTENLAAFTAQYSATVFDDEERETINACDMLNIIVLYAYESKQLNLTITNGKPSCT